MNKPIEETHPTLKRVKTIIEFQDDFSAMILAVNHPNICKAEWQKNDLSCSIKFVPACDVQKHTIDKSVLREKLWKWFNEFTSQFEGGVGEIPFGSDELYEGLKDFEKELGLEEK